MRALVRGWMGAFLLSIAAQVAFGCSDPLEDEPLAKLGEGCLVDSDCGAGSTGNPLICVFRRCHEQCNTTPDCVDIYGPGTSVNCVLGSKPAHVCQLPDEVDCAEGEPPAIVLLASECPGDQVCGVDGTCRDACGTANDCVPGELCVQGTCANENELDGGLLTPPGVLSPQGAPCSYTSECVVPLVCLDHRCAEACMADIDCPEGKVCVVDGSGELGPIHRCQKPVAPGAPGEACDAPGDCTSSICTANVCAQPRCDDLTKNGTETGEDCGGTCSPCPPGTPCSLPTECTTGLCVAGTCFDAGCGNALQDGDESDVDCGGSCPGCATDQTCYEPGDCASIVCTAFACGAASCADGLANGGEMAVDCGGPCVQGCGLGAPCTDGTDCATVHCGTGLTCEPPSCTDTAMNGAESDVDCGGGCPPCATGADCNVDADCAVPADGCHPSTELCTAKRALSVTVVGPGTVASVPAGLIPTCSSTCGASLFDDASATLAATPGGGGATFVGWSGGCVGTGNCVLTMSADRNVTATFTSPLGEWQASVSNGNAGQTTGLAFDAQGSVYLGGTMDRDTDFGGGTLVRIATGTDAFIAKYASSGAHIWSSNFANSSAPANSHATREVVVAQDGDPILAITANGNLRLNGSTLVTCAATNALALVRLDGVTGLSPTGACHGQNINVTEAIVEPDDDVVVFGTFTGSVNFGGGTLVAVGAQPFVARYDGTTLAYEYAAALGDGGFTVAPDAARSSGGHYVVSGTCTGDVDFGGGVVSNNPSGDGSSTDLCFLKLDAALQPVWVRQFGENSADAGDTADFYGNGDVLAVGRFRATVDFGDGVLRDSGTSDDIVMLRLAGATGALANPTPNQSVAMYAPVSSGVDAFPRDVVVAPGGAIYLLGDTTWYGAIDFGGGPSRHYLVELESLGVHVQTRGHNGLATPNTVRLGPNGVLVVTGNTFSAGAGDYWGMGPIGQGASYAAQLFQ